MKVPYMVLLCTVFVLLVGCGNGNEETSVPDVSKAVAVSNAAARYARALELASQIHQAGGSYGSDPAGKEVTAADWDTVTITKEVVATSERYDPALEHLIAAAKANGCD